MIHYIYLGYFDHEGDFIKFEKRADTKPAWYRPVVVRPRAQPSSRTCWQRRGSHRQRCPRIGDSRSRRTAFWRVIGTREAVNARDFVKRLVLRTGCDVADYTSLSLVSLDELWPAEPMSQAYRASDKVVR